MKSTNEYLKFYAVTDRTWLNKTLEEDVRSSLEGGVSCVQLREKSLNYEEFLHEAKIIKRLCDEYSTPFIVNDNLEVAINSNANGIHVGQDDLSASEIKKVIKNNMILGVSVQTVAEAIKAEKDGANYLGVGAVFNTSTKNDAKSVSIETLKEICENVSIPVVAIGGITEENIKPLKDSGICGVALVSEIFNNKDIKSKCVQLSKIINETF